MHKSAAYEIGRRLAFRKYAEDFGTLARSEMGIGDLPLSEFSEEQWNEYTRRLRASKPSVEKTRMHIPVPDEAGEYIDPGFVRGNLVTDEGSAIKARLGIGDVTYKDMSPIARERYTRALAPHTARAPVDRTPVLSKKDLDMGATNPRARIPDPNATRAVEYPALYAEHAKKHTMVQPSAPPSIHVPDTRSAVVGAVPNKVAPPTIGDAARALAKPPRPSTTPLTGAINVGIRGAGSEAGTGIGRVGRLVRRVLG